ncbi:MAG: hypothetical protein D3908_16640 [Candidatus Electrothrix sp. AUS4]|nr:hypothetical protein [Candidatus Electrothrix sp. AUS4]
MSITHLIVFLVQFFLFVPLFFILFIKAPRGSKNKKVFLIVALVSICYASVDAYFHRYLIMSDFYYAQGDWKKSGEVAEEGFKYLEDKSELYDFVYGRFSLYRKMKRAKEKDPEQNKPVTNQEVSATQETITQDASAGNEDVSTEQEDIEQEDSVVDDEVSAGQEEIEQEQPVFDEEAPETPEETDEGKPEGAAAGE